MALATDVFLHIGAPKTGTSFIQLSLWQNRKQVEALGFTLPLGRRQLQFDAVADMRGGIWSNDGVKATWADLVAAVRAAPGPCIVSEELLNATPEEKVADLVASLAPARVHVIMAARDVGRQIPAEWQQAVRGRSPKRYDSWLEELRDDPTRPFWMTQDPSLVLARWAPYVLADRLHLITVPPSGADPGELWRRFASIVGLPEEGLGKSLEAQNPSLGLLEAEVLRRVNERLGARLPLHRPYTLAVRDHFMRPVLFKESAADRVGVPAEHAGWLTERSKQIAHDVREMGVHVVGDVDDLVSTIVPSDNSPDAIPDHVVLDGAVDAIIGMLVHLEKDVLPVLEARREAERTIRSLHQANRKLQARVDALTSRRGAVRNALRAVVGR